MGKIKNNIGLSEAHKELGRKVDEALKEVSKKLIAEAKAINGYLIVSDKDGNPKKVWAKDL